MTRLPGATPKVQKMAPEGSLVSTPSNIHALRASHPELDDWLWALVKVDPAMLDNTLERVSISLPRRVLHRLDARARSAGRLNETTNAQGMNLPGWGLHPLKGRELKGHFSVWVNGNWRMTFTFDGTDAVLVDYQDYH